MTDATPECTRCGHTWEAHNLPRAAGQGPLAPDQKPCIGLNCKCSGYTRDKSTAEVVREELAKWLVEWCSEHGSVESSFLYPNPAHYVFTFDLFDDLAKKLGVDKEKLGEWFNAAQERRAAKRAAARSSYKPTIEK